MSCFLHQLSRNFSDNLIGLRITPEGKVSVWEEAFSCCSQQGLHFIEKLQAYAPCTLHKRLTYISQLLTQYELTWQKPFAHYPRRNDPEISKFIRYLPHAQKASKGWAFCSASSREEASAVIWLMAIAAIWRFGIKAHVLSIGKAKIHDFLPSLLGERQLILCEHKAPFRYTHTSYDFSVLVNWCEGAMIPLWIDVLKEEEDVQNLSSCDSPGSLIQLKTAFKQRISQYTSAPPLSWLASDCQSRLKNICAGFEKYC